MFIFFIIPIITTLTAPLSGVIILTVKLTAMGERKTEINKQKPLYYPRLRA